MADETPQRRSIWDRIAEKQAEPDPLVEVDFDFLGESTATFRVEHTGQLVPVEAGTLAGGLKANESLGELDLNTASAYHLLALPGDSSGEEIEALAISVWNEAGWINPGVLHLTEGVTLEGPWHLSGEAASELGFSSDVWLLRCQPSRGAAPSADIVQRDELARAFPDGMPVGVELSAISVLRRVARRLGGQLRVAGSGHVFTPDPDSAVNLRIYTADPIEPDRLQQLMSDLFGGVTQVSSPPTEPGSPHALLVAVSPQAQMLVGMRPVEEVPRVLRWEGWVRGPVYVYECNWANSFDHALPSGQLTRVGRRARNVVAESIGRAAAAISEETRNVAIVDEDDFLVLPEEILPAED